MAGEDLKKKTGTRTTKPADTKSVRQQYVPPVSNIGNRRAGGNTLGSNAGSVVSDDAQYSPRAESVVSTVTVSKFTKKITEAIRAANVFAAKQPVKTSVLQDIIALNNSVGIDEGNPRDVQIIELRKGGVPSEAEMSLPTRFAGLDLDVIQQLVTFNIKVLPRYAMPSEPMQQFTGGIKAFEQHVWPISKSYPDRTIFKDKGDVLVAATGAASATSFSLANEDPLSDLKRIIESDATYEDKLLELKRLRTSNSKANEIVLRYQDLKATDSYKVTCIAIELELISEQINCYKKDLEEAFNSYCSSGNVKLSGVTDHKDVLENKGLSKHMCAQTYREDIEHLTQEFNEKYAAFLEQRNEIEANHVQNYGNLTAAEKHPSIQKFKSEILSEEQFSEVFAGVTLSGIQFEALREIESILLNPKSRSKPLVSFNMGEGKSFLIELVRKYAAVIERDKQMAEYEQVSLDEKIERVATLELQIEMHKEAIKAQKGGRSFTKDGTSIPLAEAKLIVKALEGQLGKVRREVNQTRLRGLKIEIIDRANEEAKLAELNAKGNLKNTLIFWDESRYGLQGTSQRKLGSQLRSFKDKEANLVLVGATVNEIKLVEAVNRARDKGRTKYDIDKLGYDLKEFRKRKDRAIKKITESSLEKETEVFAQKWAEIVRRNHVGEKKSQHVFLDLNLEHVSREELEVGLRKIIEGAGPQIAMVNFIVNGEYRCLIAKKGGIIINTKVGNKEYYKAILRDSRIPLPEGDDRELTVAEKDLISKTKNITFVENIAEIYGERYSIGGVYDKADVLKGEEDSQILYISKAEKINLAEIGQAQSRNRSSKPLKGKIVIQGEWASQIADPKSLAERALSNFEIRDLEEFVEDLDSKMAKYFQNEQGGRKCSEVLSEIELSNEERVRIIGGDVGLIMNKFSRHIDTMEGDIRHKFFRDVKLFIHYSSLRDVKTLEREQAIFELALGKARSSNQDYRALELNFQDVTRFLDQTRLDYAPLVSDDYEYEFDQTNLGQSMPVLVRHHVSHSSTAPTVILKANEEFIDHFSRLPYSKKTQACLDSEARAIREREKYERENKKRLDGERLRRMNVLAAEVQRAQREEDNLQKYLSDIAKEAEVAGEERLRLEEERAKLEQELKDEERKSEEPKFDHESITAALIEQLENINKRIAEKKASEAGLLSQKESAVSGQKTVESRMRKLQRVINVIKGRDNLLAGIRKELQSLYDQSSEREKKLVHSEELMARMVSDLEALKIEGDEEQLELDGVIAESDKKAEQIRAITQSIKSSNDQIQELYSQKIECDAKIGSFLEQKKLLESQNKSLKILDQEAKDRLGALTDTLGKLEPQQLELQEKLSAAREEVGQLTQNKKEKGDRVAELETEKKELNSAIAQAQQQILALESRISGIEQILVSDGKTNQGYEQLVIRLSNEISELELSISTETSLLERLKEKAQEKLLAQQEIRDELSTVIKKQEALATEKGALEKQIEKAREDHVQKTSQKDAVVKAALEVQQKSAELGEQLSILEQSLSEKNQALENARQEGARLRSTLTEAETQIDDLQKQIDSSRSQLEILEQEVSAKSQKIASITRGIESIEQEMEYIKQRASAEEDIEKRTALTAALLETIKQKQLELESSEVAQGTSELYSAKLRELSESLEKSFMAAVSEQERARQELDLKRDLEKRQLIETFQRDLESQIKDLTEVQSEKDVVTQRRIDEMTIENEVLRENLLQKERLIDLENLLKRQMGEKEIEIAQLKEAALQQEMNLRKLEEEKILFERIANDAKANLEEKVSLDAVNQSEQDSLLSRNLFLTGEIDKQKEGFDRQTRDLRAELEKLEEKKSIALAALEDTKSELNNVKSARDQLAIQIQESEQEYDQVKEQMNRECEELESRLSDMQQQHDIQIQILENMIEELQSHQPEPYMEQVRDLENDLVKMRKEFSAHQENLQHQIRENVELQQRVVELTATKSKELEAPESRGKKGPAKVNMELAEQALDEQIRVLNLSPEELKRERSEQHESERQRKHVIDGFKYSDEVTQIVAPITPSVLSLRNFYPGGETTDQRYYYIEFRKLTFQEEPKTAEEKSGIFNDAVLYEAKFRHCKFHSIDFSRIDPKIFGTIKFNECRFEGAIKLPNGFKLEDGKIESSEAAEIPKSTTTLRAVAPDGPRSGRAMRSPRVNIHAPKPVKLLDSTVGRGRGGGREED